MPCSRMAFAGGNSTEILFPGWPGTAPGMYAMALGAIFAAAVLVEWCNHGRPAWLTRGGGAAAATSGLVRASVHGARVGLSYVLMLAVMSFDVGVLSAAVLGHAVGFLAFGSGGFGPHEQRSREMKADPSMAGC